MDATTKFRNLWSQAVKETPPNPDKAAGELMHAIGDLLDVDVVQYGRVGECAFFLLDLSTLGFKGMDLNVVMIAHPPGDELQEKEQSELVTSYKHAVQSIGFCFVIVLEDSDFSGNPHIPSSAEVVYICGADLERLFSSPVPSGVLFEIIRRQVQIHQLCPFNTTKEARGSMFRGRKQELRWLVDDLDHNYLVTGARRIGKTSLLMRAYNVLRVKPDMRDRVFYFDCSLWGDFWDCAHRLAHRIEAKRETRIEGSTRNLQYFLERKSRGGSRPLILFFDEFDRVVDNDSSAKWEFLRALKEATSTINNWARVTFSGFRSVAALNEDTQGFYGSPFLRALEGITLSPLTRSEAQDLLCEPFMPLGVRFRDREAVVDHVLRSTANHPFLIQFYAERLFQLAMERIQPEITMADVESIEDSYELADYLTSHLEWNTISGGQPVVQERVCAYLYIYKGSTEGWTEQDFGLACEAHGIDMRMGDLHRALRSLYFARVLNYSQNRYTLTFPLMRQVITGSYPDMEALLEEVIQG